MSYVMGDLDSSLDCQRIGLSPEGVLDFGLAQGRYSCLTPYAACVSDSFVVPGHLNTAHYLRLASSFLGVSARCGYAAIQIPTSLHAGDAIRTATLPAGSSDVGVPAGALARDIYPGLSDSVAVREPWKTPALNTVLPSPETLPRSSYEALQIIPASMLARDTTRTLSLLPNLVNVGAAVGVLARDIYPPFSDSVAAREPWRTPELNSVSAFVGTLQQIPTSMVAGDAIRTLTLPRILSDVSGAVSVPGRDTYPRFSDSVVVREPWKTPGLSSVSAFPATPPCASYETMQLPVEKLRMVGMTHESAVYLSPRGIYGDSAILPRYVLDELGHGGAGVAFVSAVNLSALRSYELDANEALSALLAPDRASFSEVAVHSWKDWPAGPVPIDSRLGDHLASRVRGAVYEAVASHGLIEGDLIVQVVVVVQAETGAISQIGRISSN